MKKNWEKGIFNFHLKKEKRICKRKGCSNSFEIKPSDPKVYCCHSCAAKVSNKNRGSRSKETKLKISKSLKGRENPYKGIEKIPKEEIICVNCGKSFLEKRWMNRKYCSVDCAMKTIGGNPTSPKAARGKAGIRNDIDKSTYFYSRWEANIARLCDFLKIKWIHQPKVFDLGFQNYTPDFYLPEYDFYVEVKNFLNDYSKRRDREFRKKYPDLDLLLILKEDYLKLEEKYASLISNWEYKNS